MKRIVALLILFLLSGYGLTQSVPAVPAGPVRSMKNIPQGVLIELSNASVSVMKYAETVVRIRVTKGEIYPDFSYTVIEKPEGDFDEITETDSLILLKTDSLTVSIRKDPFRISFHTAEGKLLSEDYPAFGITWLGDEVTCHRTLFPGEKFIGLGEKTGPLNRRGNAYVNWNRDIPGYSDREDPLYQSIPFFIGINDRLTYGIFLDNSFKTLFNFGASTDDLFSFFSAESGELDYYFFGSQSVAGIIDEYTRLTGRMPLPPYWSLGYQQCRWGYYPESEVMSLAQKFRDKEIPCDVIYLDIDYMDAYKIFTWHPQRFPDPAGMINRLNGMGFHVVVIVDPGIKIEPGYFAYDQGIAGGYFIRYPDSSYYTGSVWPGRCHFPDFTKQQTRNWWGKSFRSLTGMGVEGFWNDMNEPSAWGQSIPDIVEFDFDGLGSTMAEAHNLYGLEMSRATYEGTRQLLSGRRPFVLTRAGFSGIQRFSAVWTGDNSATEADLMQGIRLVNSMGLSGISFAGPDVGGFIGSPSKQLFLRWLSVGIFTPFLRNHTHVNTPDQEPWAFGEDAEVLSRNMIQLRYKLLPYIYSAFYESTLSGMPVARSLAIGYPFEEKVYDGNFHHQYLFGDAFLVAPITSDQKYLKVWFPAGDWYRFTGDRLYQGDSEAIVEAPLSDLPVFVKAGSIIPMQSPVQYSDATPARTLEWHIYKGDKTNSFTWYEDDGSTYDYESGRFYLRAVTFDPVARKIIFSVPEGTYATKFLEYRMIFHGFEPKIDDIVIENTNQEFSVTY